MTLHCEISGGCRFPKKPCLPSCSFNDRAPDAAAPMVPSECETGTFPYYKAIAEHPGFTAKGAHDAFVKQYTQNQLDAAIAAERERCLRIARRVLFDSKDHYVIEALRRVTDEISDREPAIRNQEKE